MKENINKFKDLYNFEFEEIKDLSYKEIEKKYLEIYKEGKEKNTGVKFFSFPSL